MSTKITDDTARSETPEYESMAAAMRRVEFLKQFGMWPGIVNHGTSYSLTFDPKVSRHSWQFRLY